MPVLILATPEEQTQSEQTEKRTNALMNLIQRRAKERGIELTIKEPASGMVDEPPLPKQREPKRDE